MSNGSEHLPERKRKMRVAHNGHIIEGHVEFGAGAVKGDKVEYSLSLTEGYFVCGPHDAEGNHIGEEA